MKVVALKPILYRPENGSTRIFDKGEVLEMDDATFYVREKRGDVAKVKTLIDTEAEIINVSEGLPALDEVPQRKKKNGNA